MNNCQGCGHYELKKMVTSGQPYGYSGDIPCLRCTRFNDGFHDEHTSAEEKDAQEWMNASLGKPSKYVHYVIQVEPNNTIGLYKDGKSVKSIDFWILDGRADK